MKKSFKIDHSFRNGMLFDETINYGFDATIFTGYKKLSKKIREECLADLGTGSETEYQSAKTLYVNYDNSPKFLDWLIDCSENRDAHFNSEFCWAFLNFQDDERVLPVLLKSFSKCPDEHLGNYPALLGFFGGEKVKKALKQRFYKLKENPQAFAKYKNWNDLGFSLLDICEILLEIETDNIEAAECLVKLSKHPNFFNKTIALNKVSKFYKAFETFRNSKTKEILGNNLKSFSGTKNSEIFGIILGYLFEREPERTYEKFKKIYLKTKKKLRYNHLASPLIRLRNPVFWISKLVKELPYEDSEYFRDHLNWNQIKPIDDKELVSAIREDFASESPNKRISSLGKLKYIKNEEAQKILEEALSDEPDDFIRKQFEKHLRKLKR